MAISPARMAAFDILLRVEQQDSYASELLHSSQYDALSPADHRLATELVMGVLRWRSVLDDHIAEQSSQALAKLDVQVLTALRLAAYQLLFLSRVPAHAAVHESVELVKRARKRSAAPFVNAVLRKISKAEGSVPAALPPDADPASLGKARAHPAWLVSRWAAEFGANAARSVCEYDQHHPPAALRLSDAAAQAELERGGIHLAPGRLISSARRVESGDLARSRLARLGQVAIQDEASQLVALLAGFGSRILDCCAAPGGKTRILAERNPAAFILAADLHPRRAGRLRTLIPAANIRVIAADAQHLPLLENFDRVLVDAPCSGTGTLAHNPEIKWRLKPDDLADLHSRQTAILRAAMQHVSLGGRLIYSTCSLEPEENENVVDQAISEHPEFRILDCRQELDRLHREGELVCSPESLTRGPYLRTIPGVHPCDGFFAALMGRKM